MANLMEATMNGFKLGTFQYQQGANKGKLGIKLYVDGSGWQGISPNIVREILKNADALEAIVSHTDAELIRMVTAQSAQVAHTALAVNGAQLQAPTAPQTFNEDELVQRIAAAVLARLTPPTQPAQVAPNPTPKRNTRSVSPKAQ